MRKINDTNELLKAYNKYKDEIVSKVKKRITKSVCSLQRYSCAYNTVKEEILACTGTNITNCQCNKLAYLVLEEIRKGVE